MNSILVREFLRPLIVFFIAANALCLVFGAWLDAKGIDHIVLMYANLILFLLTVITSVLHIKAINTNNPYAFVRGITVSAFIKLIVIGASVLLYLSTAGEKRNIYAIAAAMLLYIVYTILEVTGAMRMNRKKNVES